MLFLRLSLLLAGCLLPIFPQNYTFETFTVPYAASTETVALGINNRGAIAGFFKFGAMGQDGQPISAARGFKRDADGVFEFPIIAPTDDTRVTLATSLNDSDEMVGYTLDSENNFHGFLLRGGKDGNFTTIDIPTHSSTWVYGINNAGDFAGATGPGFQLHGFVSRGGTVSLIDFPGAVATEANAVAADGTVVGCYTNGSVAYGYLRGPKGNFLGFKVADAIYTCAVNINDQAGKIVGVYRDSSGFGHGFVYDYVHDLVTDGVASKGRVRTISVDVVDFASGAQTTVTGINSKGVIVGSVVPPEGPTYAFTGTPKQ